MDGGVVRLILAAIAAVMILCVSVSGTDLTIVLLGGIALALIWRGRPQDPKEGITSPPGSVLRVRVVPAHRRWPQPDRLPDRHRCVAVSLLTAVPS